MSRHITEVEVIQATDLTVSAGATPSVTSKPQTLANADMTTAPGLILINSGASTSLTVTYQIGYKIPLKDAAVVWVGGTTFTALAQLTTVNCPGDAKYGVCAEISTPCNYVRFKVTNADAGNTATVRLILLKQV